MPGKRSEHAVKAPAAKKMKVDPTTEKLNSVIEALKDAECAFPEPAEATRTAVLAVLPHAIGVGAASNERHIFQSNVVGIIGEILAATEVKWQRKLAEATAECDTAKAEQASRDAVLAGARSRLETFRKAENALQLAKSEVENFDAIQAVKADERDQFAAGLSEDFEGLKASAWESPSEQKKHVSKITSLLRKLPSKEASLLSALPPALAKKASDRGMFDETVISNVESILKEHLASLEADLGNGEALKSQKESLANEAQATLNRVMQEVQTSPNKLTDAEMLTKELEAEELKLDTASQEQAEVVSDLDIQAFNFKVYLQNCQEVLTAFAFLRDRVDLPTETEEGNPAEEMATEEHPEPVAIAA